MKITDNKFKCTPRGETDIEKIMDIFLMAGYSRVVSKNYAEECLKKFLDSGEAKKNFRASINCFVMYDFTLEQEI